jgi:branched-chain amino acid transport system ATP-binding protein
VSAALTVDRVVVEFASGTRALDGASLSVDLRRSHALLGANGSGKTSLFNTICGYYPLKAGSILLGARDIGGLKSHERVALGVGRSLQSVASIEELTPREYVSVGLDQRGNYLRRLLPTPRHVRLNKLQLDRAGELLADVDLGRYADLRLDVCPYGVRKLVDVVRVFAGSPTIVLLDEPTSGVSGSERGLVADLIAREMTRVDACMVLIDHDVDFVQRLCATATILASGKVIADGLIQDVLRERAVVETFTGI